MKLRIPLGILEAAVALNAFGGGLYGILGAEGVPADWLEGSPFRSYLLPSLFLFFGVGGIFLAASIAAFARHRFASRLSLLAGLLLMAWIAAQMAVIGFVSWLQPVMMAVGLAVAGLSPRLRRDPASPP